MSTRALPLVVVGAGPAGIAAAVEARRCGGDVVLLDESGAAGGGIRVAYEVRNVPFLPDRTPGELVADALRAFAFRWGLEVARRRCVRVDSDDDAVSVSTSDGVPILGCGVVVATGTRALLPKIEGLPPGFEAPWARSAPDAWAAAPLESAAIVGGSDVAFDQARWLRAAGVAVSLLCRGSAPKAPPWLVEAARDEGVDVLCATRVASGTWLPPRLALRLERDGHTEELCVDRIVPAVGRAPAWREAIFIDPAAMKRVRIAGDAAGRRARHVTAALGDGCTAATELLALARERGE